MYSNVSIVIKRQNDFVVVSRSFGEQEAFAHGEKHSWTSTSLYQHFYRLFDTLSSSKEVCEDAFGFGADSKRKNKNPFKAQSVERFWFVAQRQTRLPMKEFPRVEPHLEDFETTSSEPHNKGIFVAGGLNLKGTTLEAFKVAGCRKRAGRMGRVGWGFY